jgi:hypothetical protein
MPDESRPRYNRDEDQRPGRPPRPATEPPGSEGSSRSSKTMTDPASGEPLGPQDRPNQSQSDEADSKRD